MNTTQEIPVNVLKPHNGYDNISEPVPGTSKQMMMEMESQPKPGTSKQMMESQPPPTPPPSDSDEEKVVYSPTDKAEVTMDTLKYMFATRDTLTEKGFKNLPRFFLHERRMAAEKFRELADSMPEVYGEIGSDNWIRGYLCHLNEPGTVARDDVDRWLAGDCGFTHIFYKKKTKKATSEKKGKLVSATITGGDQTKPRLKHAVISLRKCDEEAGGDKGESKKRKLSCEDVERE